tara:strand:- start:492 stop:716 length:225 start_codon:yes stop_codon:yes gene_type:complete
MSDECLIRTSNKGETPKYLDVLKQNNLPERNTKRICVNVLNKRLQSTKKKDKLRNLILISSIFVSIGFLGFIAG